MLRIVNTKVMYFN